MAKNDFKPFATGSGANVMSQTDWEALPALLAGFQSGKASSAQMNKAFRQSSFIAAALAQFIADTNGTDVLDNGNFSDIVLKLKSAISTASTGRLLNVRTFTSSGTYTPTAGTKFVVVEAIGGGGAGGGAPATAASTVSVGGGGTAGSYGKSIYLSGFSGVTVTIGSGGSPASGTGGGAGGSTSFGSLLVCSGGGGGLSQGPSSPGFGPLGSPAGGAVTGANIFWSPGEPGGYSFTATGVVCPGIGASSKMGSGGTLNTINSNGTSGNGYGAGGSGAGNNISQTAKSGGPGSGGIVVVWEYA